MSATFQISLSPGDPGDEVTELQILCELVVKDNVAWMERMEAQGYEVPCCAKCAGVHYVPPKREDYERAIITIDGAQRLLAQKRGACGAIAAYDAAAKRLEGEVAWVEIVPQGKSYYHAIVGTPEGTYDPTAKMALGGSQCACLRAS